MNLANLRSWATQNRKVLLVGGGGGIALLAYARSRATAKPSSDSTGTSTGTPTYENLVGDTYNALQPQIEAATAGYAGYDARLDTMASAIDRLTARVATLRPATTPRPAASTPPVIRDTGFGRGPLSGARASVYARAMGGRTIPASPRPVSPLSSASSVAAGRR